jgi:hypothetical protein
VLGGLRSVEIEVRAEGALDLGSDGLFVNMPGLGAESLL